MKAPKDKPIFEQVNTMGGKEKIFVNGACSNSNSINTFSIIICT